MGNEPSYPSDTAASKSKTDWCAIALLAIHAILLGYASYVNGPNMDEPAHLASGISHWKLGQFELYRVNPPLVRMIGALPVLATNVQTEWSEWQSESPYARPEFHVGRAFVIKNGPAVFWYFTLARWACIPICLVGATVVYLWSRELYGRLAGLISLWLYCFGPNLIAWGASLTPDAAGASMGVLASYTFWKWLQSPRWSRASVAGFCLGLAELTKSTWIILFALFPLIWVLTRRTNPAPHRNSPLVRFFGSRDARQLAAILAIALYCLNLGFGFEGTFKPLGQFTFVSRALTGKTLPTNGGNRFADQLSGMIPVPLPENYVRGLDVQKHDFERGGWSYLCGTLKWQGWWYYYLAAYLFKSPIGTLVIFAMATCAAMATNRRRSDWRSELMIMVPAVAVMALVSSQTGFNRYLRYALPFAPFALIHCGRVAMLVSNRRPLMSSLICLCCLEAAVESLSVFPHSLSFFNLMTGGPLHGQNYLQDGNIDWDQDILFLKTWYDEHPEARPFHFERFGILVASPEAAGIESAPVPAYVPENQNRKRRDHSKGPLPGWFALSVNHVMGYKFYGSEQSEFTYFQRLKPVARVGYSIVIYHLTKSDANLLRAELNLDQIP